MHWQFGNLFGTKRLVQFQKQALLDLGITMHLPKLLLQAHYTVDLFFKLLGVWLLIYIFCWNAAGYWICHLDSTNFFALFLIAGRKK